MCGRFTLSTAADIVADVFDLADIPELRPRYNIAPTQTVTAVVAGPPPSRRAASFRWGLVPGWAKDLKLGARMINARSETVASKPAFRSAFKRRRCLVPADGFYEWIRVGKDKQPMLIGMADGGVFGMAGLWEHWNSPEGQVVETCTVLTGAPNEVAAQVHDRMPIILPPDAWDTWLDPRMCDRGSLEALLVPYPADRMAARPVSRRVNNVRNDDPGCLEAPAGPGTASGAV